MATPYIKNDGPNYRIQAGLPTGGVLTIQPTDSASNFTMTIPAANFTAAQDALVVHLAGIETLTGAKTFSSLITASAGINFGQTNSLTYYDEGTWTPSPNSVTTTGSPTYLGVWRRVGRLVWWQLSMAPSGGTIATTGGTSFFSGLPFTSGNSSAGSVVDSVIGTTYGSCLVTGTNVYLPTMASSSNNRFATGVYSV